VGWIHSQSLLATMRIRDNNATLSCGLSDLRLEKAITGGDYDGIPAKLCPPLRTILPSPAAAWRLYQMYTPHPG
jgi:hypothetical protein